MDSQPDSAPATASAPRPLRASWLLWAWVLPQLLLALLNWQVWELVHGDLSALQRTQALQLGICEAALLLIGAAGALELSLRRRPISLGVAAGGLVLLVGYLWLFITRIDSLMPTTVTLWMMPQSQVLYYQFALVMPAVFLLLIRLALLSTGLKKPVDIAVSIGVMVIVPMLWYVGAMVIGSLLGRMPIRAEWAPVAIALALIACTALILVAFLRLLLLFYGWTHRWPRWILPLLAGLVAPLLGLALNAGIPFPYDFQDWSVYALTVLNGALLLAPFGSGGPRSLAVWCARTALYPFTLYFFVVFLPFLPLSLLAMVAAGAGILILAPVFLFAVHTRRLLDEARTLAGAHGAGTIALAAVLSLLVLPALFSGRCLRDRRAIEDALEAAYSPDYRATTLAVNARGLERALDHMADVKEGIYLPFLTDAYNKMVFNGMVLPDAKAEALRKLFLGDAGEKRGRLNLWGRSFWGTPRRGFRTARAGALGGPVSLEDAGTSTATDGEAATAEVTIRMRNGGAPNGEFVLETSVPEGVLVTGFWLDVGGTNVPGRLVEKKTAAWVYQMIRDVTRRDPGLVTIDPGGRLSLRVYPFAAGEVRTCGLLFRMPATLPASLELAGRTVALNAPPGEPGPIRVAFDSGEALLVPPSVLAAQPAFRREPYVHLILDASQHAGTNRAQVAKAAREALAGLPAGVSLGRVTWANYEQADAAAEPVALAKLDLSLDAEPPLPARGGFFPSRAIARVLLEEADRQAREPDASWRVPIFIAVAASGSAVFEGPGLDAFERLCPDLPHYWLATSNRLQHIAFDGSREPAGLAGPEPVVAFRSGTAVSLWTAQPEGALLVSGMREAAWECWDAEAAAFRPLPGALACTDPEYEEGLGLWARQRALALDPSRLESSLRSLAAAAREIGVLIPAMSFIVVETHAQWTMLERKEAQSLGAGSALAFDEQTQPMDSPAPAALWLLPAAVWLLARARRRAEEEPR